MQRPLLQQKRVFVNKMDWGVWTLPRVAGKKPHDVMKAILLAVYGSAADHWTLAVGPLGTGLSDYYARIR